MPERMGGSYENWYVGEVLDEFLHEAEILCTVVFGAYMNLQERDINFFHVIVVTFSRVADEQFTFWIVVLQPILEGSTYEAASDNSNVNHCFVEFELLLFNYILSKITCPNKFE